MIASFRNALFLSLVLGTTMFLAPKAKLYAQTPPPVPALHTVSLEAGKVPPLPPLKSPVDQFRALLALLPDERESRLTNRPPHIRARILAKLAEYDAMKPADRDLLLRNTQLRWYLLTLMEAPPAARETQLAMVSEEDRPFVKKHLEAWDRISADEQREVLKYEKLMEGLLTQGITNAAIVPPPPTGRDNIKTLNAYLSLPQDKREQMYASFQKFFELSDEERQATVGTLPQRDRMQMTIALRNFDRLPKPQRDRCVRSFAKFSDMSETDRQEFLKNAERWREMSAEERQAWRDLVNKVPPLPPLPLDVPFPPRIPRMPLVQSGSGTGN